MKILIDKVYGVMRIFFLSALLLSAGCVTTGYTPVKSYHRKLIGVYHKVQRGETLWRIAKTYQIDIYSIVEANRIPDAAKITAGQLLFIPGAIETREVIGLEEVEKDESIFIWPIKGKVVSFFGSKDKNIKNKGIDIKAEQDTNVVAARSGRVFFCCDDLKGYGKTVIIDHGDGFSTVYAHNSELLVEVGQLVKKGQLLAKVGLTGRTFVPKVHFEIRKKAKPQNPFYYLP